MLHSVRVFLFGIIDYAGLFPPAKLPLDKAIRKYARHRAELGSWMLGRFIVPASRLAELDAHVSQFTPGPPLPIAALGSASESLAALPSDVEADLEAITTFRARHGAAVRVDAYEAKWPPDALPRTAQALVQAELSVFCEVPPTSPAALFERMRGGPAGVKLRCGGLEAATFPTPEQVAAVIVACRDNGLTMKFTAGLHHPLRRFDRGVGAKMHGFLNVFGAAILAHALGLTEAQVREVIEDEEPSNFGFDELGFGWKQYHALAEEVIAARRQFVLSFGSCSFEEPRDDLRAMGILT